MTTDRLPCRNPDCAGSRYMDREFCVTCETLLQRDTTAVLRDVDKALHDEAAFIRFCEEHGFPHPHE